MGSSQPFEAIRFQIIVYNFERIDSFIRNFHRIQNFRPQQDRILVLDCSRDRRSQEETLEEFCALENLEYGRDVSLVPRRNRGIDQGARLDYFELLHRMKDPPRYVWQFQDHFLDLESMYSFWPSDQENPAPRLKSDTIPDSVILDLDVCTEIYEKNLSVDLIYADRGKIKLFEDGHGHEWLYTSGGNFCFRTESFLKVLTPKKISRYRSICDNGYGWALFMEMEWGRIFHEAGLRWFDLVTSIDFSSVKEMKAKREINGIPLYSSGNYEGYRAIYKEYLKRLDTPHLILLLRKWIRAFRNLPILNPIKPPLRLARHLLFTPPEKRGTLHSLTALLIYAGRLKKFKFVEIGVFKGDNAVDIITLVQSFRVEVHYVGFDLFDEAEEFYKSTYSSEWAVFDSPDQYEYWEFRSGQHKFDSVGRKIGALLPKSSFRLIPGDTRETLPSYSEDVEDSNLIYIDGSHQFSNSFQRIGGAWRI